MLLACLSGTSRLIQEPFPGGKITFVLSLSQIISVYRNPGFADTATRFKKSRQQFVIGTNHPK
jgi:hypothetical protein